MTRQLTLGNADDSESIEGKPLRGATVDEPTVMLAGIAEVVRVIAARPAWQRDQPLPMLDIGYALTWKEMHKVFVVGRGFAHVPWDEGLIERGTENFVLQGSVVVPAGDSGERIALSLDVAKELNKKNRVDLWSIKRRPRNERI
jgi:hypothetical protein